MFLECLILGLEVQVAVHQGLVGVVHCFQVGILASLLNLKAVELGLETLQLRGQFVSHVVLSTVLGEFVLLLLNKHAVSFLQIIDLKIKAMNS